MDFTTLQCANLFSLATFLLGLFLGNRLAIGRALRQEFNTIAQPLREALLRERERPTPYAASLSDIDLDRLIHKTALWDRPGLRRAHQAYRQAKAGQIQRDSLGGASYADTTTLVAALDRLLIYTLPH